VFSKIKKRQRRLPQQSTRGLTILISVFLANWSSARITRTACSLIPGLAKPLATNSLAARPKNLDPQSTTAFHKSSETIRMPFTLSKQEIKLRQS
jgi:hypothetical protein